MIKRVISGPGIIGGAYGRTLSLSTFQRPKPNRRSVSPSKFQLIDASDGATLKVKILNGTVNGISPTFTGASPSGVLSDDPPPLLTITSTTYFWLKCVGTFGTPDSYVVSVYSNTTGIQPSDSITGTGFESYWAIGYVEVSGSPSAIVSITQRLTQSQQVESFGSSNFWW